MKLLRIAAGLGLAVASVLAFAAPSSAQTNWTGAYFGPQTAFVMFNVDWANAGTPDQQLRGVMTGGNAGYRFQLGPILIGGASDFLVGRLTQCQRDGNYIVECGTLHSLGTLRGILGFATDQLVIYGTAGIAWNNMTQTQSCPAPAAVVAGWCKTHGPYNLAGRGTTWGPVFGGGLEIGFGEERRVSAFAEVLFVKAFRPFNFGPLMGPDGDGHATLPDQIVLGSAAWIQMGLRIRF